MSIAKYLLKQNLIQIDKHKPKFYELKTLLDFLESEIHLTLFVAYKQDIDDDLPNLNFIRIDLNFPCIKKNHYLVLSSKNYQPKTLKSKSEVIDFVKNNL